MRIVFLSLIFLLLTGISKAQNSATPDAPITPASAEMFVDEYANRPTESRIVPVEFFNIDGSPFVTEEWVKATVIVDSAHSYQNVMIRLNVYDNKIHFKDFEGKERMLTTKVSEIKITDPNSPYNNSIFLTGFSPNKNEFYRVLVDGPKVRLLEKYSARKTDIKVFNGEPKTQFDVDKDVYFYSVSVKNMYKGTKKIAEILDVFGNDKKVTEYVYLNGLRGNKKEDAIKIATYYNSY